MILDDAVLIESQDIESAAMTVASARPLLVPLKREHFIEFRDGHKTVEYRLYGPRWNERTCHTGRAVILSCGYSGPRLRARIIRFERVMLTTTIYGPDRELAAIHVTNIRNVTK
jgi:hypothetical protein